MLCVPSGEMVILPTGLQQLDREDEELVTEEDDELLPGNTLRGYCPNCGRSIGSNRPLRPI